MLHNYWQGNEVMKKTITIFVLQLGWNSAQNSKEGGGEDEPLRGEESQTL